MDALLDKRTKSKVESKLQTLGKGFQGLDQAYDDAIRRIDTQLPDDMSLAKQALSWIVNAKRPLTTTEICHALATERNDVKLDLDNVPDIEELFSVCAGLVTVEEERQVVRLVHYTAQEYFEQIQKDWMPNAHIDIASTCLVYLSFDDFRNIPPERIKVHELFDQHPFSSYAAKYWGEHLRPVQDVIREQALSFLRDEALWFFVSQAGFLLSKIRGFYEDLTGRTGLHLSALFGLRGLLEHLLSGFRADSFITINAKDSHDCTSLDLAIEHGHESTVMLLLEAGADIEATGRQSMTPLQAAAFHGRESIVTLLIESGAYVDAKSSYLGYALQVASYKGFESIVQILLDNGASINASGPEFGSAFQAAAYNGHEDIMKLLISRGADVHADGGLWGNALSMAALGGHEDVVTFLLNEGVDMHGPVGHWGNALQAASAMGRERIIELLLKRGADVNAQSGNKAHTALQSAAFIGHTQVVQLLLDNGADVNMIGGQEGTALQAAASKGDENIVKLLIERGANINAESGRCGTALRAALVSEQAMTMENRLRMVNLLLDQQADVNARCGNYGSALQAAASARPVNPEIVTLLLEKGADVNSTQGIGRTFLGHLAYNGDTTSLRLAKERYGASFNTLDSHGRSTLQLAASGGHVTTFNYLLSAGVDSGTKDAKGDSLLHYASSGWSLDILNVILTQNIEFETQSKHWTPLHWACRIGHLETIERLIESGLPSESVSLGLCKEKWTPYSIALFHGHGHIFEGKSASYKLKLGKEDPTCSVITTNFPGQYKNAGCDGCFHVSYTVESCNRCSFSDRAYAALASVVAIVTTLTIALCVNLF